MSRFSGFVAAIILAAAVGTGLPGHAQTQIQPEAPTPAPQPAARKPVLYAIVYRQGPTWKVGTPLLGQDIAAHSAYMKRLTAEGVIVLAGPLLTVNGGLVLLKVASLDAARAVAAADPAVTSGLFLAEVSAYYLAFDPGDRFKF